jgi:hypothetical protein
MRRSATTLPGENYSGTTVQAGSETLARHNLILPAGYTNTFEAFMSWLSNVGGIVIGTDWYEGCSGPTTWGRFIQPASSPVGIASG